MKKIILIIILLFTVPFISNEEAAQIEIVTPSPTASGIVCQAPPSEPLISSEQDGFTENTEEAEVLLESALMQTPEVAKIPEKVEPTVHKIAKRTVYPTSTSDGCTECYCKECSYSYIEKYISAKELYGGAYGEGNTSARAWGVDVSKWNKEVDFFELADAGIDFVIIKAGSTRTGKDPYFEKNYKNARAAGLDVGCYFYSYAMSADEAKKDAEKFCAWLDGKKFEYPAYFDLEDPSQEILGREVLTDICVSFIETVQRNGFFCGLYVNDYWMANCLEKETIVARYDLWLARWPYDRTPVWREDYGKKTALWQYSEVGKVGSHEIPFDMNIAFKDYPSIIKAYGLNGY